MKMERWLRLRPLLDQALELHGEARQRFLAALGDDNELRCDLERLLADHEKLGPQTAPNAFDLATPVLAERLNEDAELDQARVGQKIGPYRLVRLLGTGGMGAVYLAERFEAGFGQIVALKVVRKALAHQARDRFERERQILAGLKHVGIAALFDGGETDEGQSFYTMEYVDGEAITDYCNHCADTVAARMRLLLQVATTLAYAHQNLIVHRDIKPSNVLVAADGRVKLVDFGLAKLLDEHAMPSLTQTGLGPMTPVYAAPEQFLNGPTTVATDIYQFGVLCFLVLTGGLPYRADPKDSLRWARAVTEDEPITLAQAARSPIPTGDSTHEVPLRLLRQLTRDLDAIVRKALAKSPGQRYRSMDAMSTDLEAFLECRPISARRAGPLYFATRFVQRRRYAVGATVLAVIALTAVGIVALKQSLTAVQQSERAAREVEVRNVTRAMLTDLLRVGPASAAPQRPKSALEALDQGTERTLGVLGGNLQHRAIAVSVLAESYLELEHPQRARDLIEQTLPALNGQLDSMRTEVLQLDLLRARAAAELGDIGTSKRALDRAEIAIRALDLPEYSPSRLAAALVHVEIEEHEGSQEHVREIAAQLLRDNDRPGLNDTLEFAHLLHVSAMQTDDESLSIELFERARKITASHYGEDSPASRAAQRWVIMRDLFGPHRLDTNRLLAEQETWARNTFGEQSLDYAELLRLRCEQAYGAHAYEEGVACWKKVLAIYEQAPDTEILVATVCDYIATDFLKLGQPANALPYYEREFALRSKEFAPSNREVLHSRIQIAKTRCMLGEIDRATRDWDEAMDAYVASAGPLRAWEAVYAAYFATCLLDAGRVESARSTMERHGKLDPPRMDMTEENRTYISGVWERLSRPL